MVLLLAVLLQPARPQLSGQGWSNPARERRQVYANPAARLIAQPAHHWETLTRTSVKKELMAAPSQQVSRPRRQVYASARARKLARMAARWDKFLSG